MNKVLVYEEWLVEKLKDRALAVEYLDNAVKEMITWNTEESWQLLVMAAKSVVKAAEAREKDE